MKITLQHTFVYSKGLKWPLRGKKNNQTYKDDEYTSTAFNVSIMVIMYTITLKLRLSSCEVPS